MTTVFVVRPFGSKRPVIKKNKEGNADIVYYDFEKVDEVLISAAIRAVNYEGGSTQKIFESGEIKEDMFSQLLTADVVIADITIHNANVFYELGIRHALREKTTILIKGNGFDETPFDILGYKYLDYDPENPAKSLDSLIEFLKESPASSRKDSPVFNVLPKLNEQEIERFYAVPLGFSREVTIAAESKRIGNLLLLAQEAEFFTWKFPALRFIGQELFKLKAPEAGRILWEKIIAKKETDIQANDRLATIYQRLADKEMKKSITEGLSLLVKSDLSIEALLRNYAALDSQKRSEVYALKGRNLKTRWINAWKSYSSQERPVKALQSIFLKTSYESYLNGFYENLNHFYSGINAFALLSIKIALVENYPTEYALGFDSDADALKGLDKLKESKSQLAVTVKSSIDAAQFKSENNSEPDIWLNITEADYRFLTSGESGRVARKYQDVLENAKDFEIESVLKQLRIYEQLQIFTQNVQASVAAIKRREQDEEAKPTHYFLFTGHMIDDKNRPEPRFPAKMEIPVRENLKIILTREKGKQDGHIIGIAGGACGGDILFHEICAELGIKTELYLALPADQFKAESVNFAGPDWTERFDRIYNTVPHHILCDTKEMPSWLQRKKDYKIWERNNLWELNSALVNGGMHMTLVALWDGKGGDGPGGTEHMIKKAQERGAKTIVVGVDETVKID